MARPRAFDEHEAVATAAGVFARLGYATTSVDDLLTALGLHRGSLYAAFGSKRGLFVAVLRRAVEQQLPAVANDPCALVATDVLDVVLVAALELAPDDDEVRALVAIAQRQLETALPEHPNLLGRRLLARAGLPDVQPAPTS